MSDALAFRERLRAHVLERLTLRGVTALDDGDSLVESGIADSLGIFQLVDFLEREAGIRVGDDEIVQANFRSVEAIVNFVGRKHGNGSGR
jgi:acyl carrier protein